jgi:hypothetical protein
MVEIAERKLSVGASSIAAYIEEAFHSILCHKTTNSMNRM